MPGSRTNSCGYASEPGARSNRCIGALSVLFRFCPPRGEKEIPRLTSSRLWHKRNSLVLISLVEYGFSVWPSTVNSSLGLVLSLVILLFGVYYGTPAGDTLPEQDEVVVPAEWGVVSSPESRKGR